MADPFSIAAGSLSVLDICVRVGVYVREVSGAAGVIEDELEAVGKDIEALQATNKAVVAAYKNFAAVGNTQSDIIQVTPSDVVSLWQETARLLEQCQSSVERLGALLKRVLSNKGVNSRMAGLKTALKMHSKEKEFGQIRQHLGILQQALNTNVSLLNM